MGKRKALLNLTAGYEQSIAIFYVAKMLEKYCLGKAHIEEVGCEQELEHWDDIVIKNNGKCYTHIQIKQNNDNFCTLPAIRGVKGNGSKKENQGKPQDKSELDKTMTSLGKWILNNPSQAENQEKLFTIALPNPLVLIKKEIKVRQLKRLCEKFSKTDTSNAEKLKLIEPSVCDWLTTWCDFKDDEHILKALILLSIEVFEDENRIKELTEICLNNYYIQTDEVIEKIGSYVHDTPEYVGTIKPRPLFIKLQKYISPNFSVWTQYENSDRSQDWSITGIHDEKYIEKPSRVVKNLWENKDRKNRSLKIVATPPPNLNKKIPQVLVQLALHLRPLCIAQFSNLDAWSTVTEGAVVTLGTEKKDIKNNLPWSQNSETLNPSGHYQLDSRTDRTAQVTSLRNHMLQVTWNELCENLEEDIEGMNDGDLAELIEKRWKYWKEQLNENKPKRNILLESMLHPDCEKNVLGKLRVGLKTVEILAESMMMRLVMSIALDDSDNASWDTTKSGYKLRSIALKFWSGTSGTRSQRITKNNGLSTISSSKRSSTVYMFSGVQECVSTSLAGNNSCHNFGHPKQPDLLVTNTQNYSNLLEAGSIKEIKEYFEQQLEEIQDSMDKTLDKAS